MLKKIGYNLIFVTIFFLVSLIANPSKAQAISIKDIQPNSNSLPVNDKYEIYFNVDTNASNPFFEYSASSQIPGVSSLAQNGVTVEALITLPSGVTITHPAFFMTDTTRTGSGKNVRFVETANKHWALRYTPVNQGKYTVQLRAMDSTGTITVDAGTFTATSPTKSGFVGVSQKDKRYFEFSDGRIFWPIGPVYWDEDFSNYKDSGLNFSRAWMAGQGAYSANWARWKSSGEQHGNEGIATRLAFLNDQERYPGSDGLAYDLAYPNAHHYWLTGWLDDRNYTPILPNTTYNIEFVAKTVGLSGPRDSAYPHGLVVKFGNAIWNNPSNDLVESTLRTAPAPFGHIVTTQGTNGWQKYNTTFTTPSNVGSDIWIYLDNVTAGQAYVYELSIKNSGAEIVRNPVADMHTYIEQRPSAFFDYQVEQAEANGIYLQYNVHDKNDPVFNSINSDGSWAGWLKGEGYNQAYNTKSSWLKRQWYRYLVARWSYSPSLFAFEAVNEEDPNNSDHWDNVQENFASYMKSISAHPTMTITSFWCCSFNDAFPFYGNVSGKYPDIDYIDLHEYSGHPNTVIGTSYTYDIPEWVKDVGEVAYSKNAGKPLVWSENGLTDSGWSGLPDSRLTSGNNGIWYHNMLWSQLTRGAAFAPGYWFDNHLSAINGGKGSITKPFSAFIKNLDFNLGGYDSVNAVLSNTNIRVYGQKKSDGTKAYFWVQNKNSEWDKTSTTQTALIDLSLKPNTDFTIESWDTVQGTIIQSTTQTTDGTGLLRISVDNLVADVAYKVYTGSAPTNPTPSSIPGDANLDGTVDGIDYTIWLTNYNKQLLGYSYGDFNDDGIVDGIDYVIWLNHLNFTQVLPTEIPTDVPSATPTIIPTPTVTITPSQPGADWPQLGHDAQRTSYTSIDVSDTLTWKYAWHWKPANYSAMPRGAHAVTGGGNIYMPAGSDGLYAINLSTGVESWHKTGITFNGTPAYGSDGYLYAGTAGGQLLKIDPKDGNTVASYIASSALNQAVLLVNTSAYVVSSSGDLVSINTQNMNSNWIYKSNSPATTPASYSASRNIIVFGTKDLYVHAVNASNGSQSWRVKPNNFSADDCHPFSYEYGWPVVADQAGIVLIRTRLDYNDTWLWGEGPLGRYPTTNSEIKTFLGTYPGAKPLVALSLTDGSQPFTPAVGNGGVDDTFTPAASCSQSLKDLYAGGKTVSTIGPLPVIKTINGHQFAYVPWRNGQVATTSWDGRWDGHMGEMVMDNTAIPGYVAGDMRFIRFNGGAIGDGMIADEFTPVTLAGNTLFHAHWGASESVSITNRDDNRGATLSNPIETSPNPYVIRRLNSSRTSNFNPVQRTANGGIPLICDNPTNINDGRYFKWNITNPPNSFFSFAFNTITLSDLVDPPAICANVIAGYGDGMRPRYTFVANGKIFVVGNGGDIFSLSF